MIKMLANKVKVDMQDETSMSQTQPQTYQQSMLLTVFICHIYKQQIPTTYTYCKNDQNI